MSFLDNHLEVFDLDPEMDTKQMFQLMDSVNKVNLYSVLLFHQEYSGMFFNEKDNREFFQIIGLPEKRNGEEWVDYSNQAYD